MASDLELDLDELPPPANQQDDRAALFAGTSSPGRSVSPVARVPQKRVARWMGDDDDDLGAIDNLFQDLDDIPDHLPPPLKKSRPSDASGVADDNKWEGDDLGIPEEEGKKKRAPKPKLDENRLLGPTGLPKLKETAKTFKFSKKGNETEDLKRLMTMYQLWAHQMFPAMNFNDTVNRVENLCKKRTLASALTNWRREAEGRAPLPDPRKSPTPESEVQPEVQRAPSESFDNDLDAALDATQASLPQPSPVRPSTQPEEDQGFNDADLDFDAEEAMLSMENQPSKAPSRPAQSQNSFDADEEAMLELEMEEFDAPMPAKPTPASRSVQAEGSNHVAQATEAQDEFAGIDFEDDEEFMREMAQAEVQAKQMQEKGKQKSIQQDLDEFADEEELLREMDAAEIEQMAIIEDVMKDTAKMDNELRAEGMLAANPDAIQPVVEEDLYA